MSVGKRDVLGNRTRGMNRNQAAAEAIDQAQRDQDQTKAAWARNLQVFSGTIWYAGGWHFNDDIASVARVLDANSGMQVLQIGFLRTSLPSNPSVFALAGKNWDAGAGLNGTETYRAVFSGIAAWTATEARFYLLLVDDTNTVINWPAVPVTKLEFSVEIIVHGG
jgi:hypothetical protein